MKDTDRDRTGKPNEQNHSNNHDQKRARRDVTIPGGAGAAGQIPIQGDDLKRKEDPLKPDVY